MANENISALVKSKENITLFTLSTAVELGSSLLKEIVGNELGSTKLNQMGQEGVSDMLLSEIQKNLNK